MPFLLMLALSWHTPSPAPSPAVMRWGIVPGGLARRGFVRPLPRAPGLVTLLGLQQDQGDQEEQDRHDL